MNSGPPLLVPTTQQQQSQQQQSQQQQSQQQQQQQSQQHQSAQQQQQQPSSSGEQQQQQTSTTSTLKPNHVRTVMLNGEPIVALIIDGKERLCLAQISNTLLKNFSYNEIHNRRVALGITCVQCTPVQLEILRRAGAMPISSRRCGMITKREAERLCKSFLTENTPPKLPENFSFDVYHECAWGCRGNFVPSRYNSSRAKCIKCVYCNMFFSPNKFIFHSHRLTDSKYTQPDAANFNSWRRHLRLSGEPEEEIVHAWEDVKAMFNGGSRRRVMVTSANGGRFQLVKRPRIEDPSATTVVASSNEVVGRVGPPMPAVNLSSTTPAVISTTGIGVGEEDEGPHRGYLPVVPFANKSFGLPPPHHHHHHHALQGARYLARNPSAGPFPTIDDKALPASPDFRRGFAEYMWGAKQMPLPPASYGLVWPSRGSGSSGVASPASDLSPGPHPYNGFEGKGFVKELVPGVMTSSTGLSGGALEELSDSSRGANGDSDRASDPGSPLSQHRPLSPTGNEHRELEVGGGLVAFVGLHRRRPAAVAHDASKDRGGGGSGSGGGGTGYLSAFRPVTRSSIAIPTSPKGSAPPPPLPPPYGILSHHYAAASPPLHPETTFPDDGRVTSTRTDRDSVASSTPMISSSDGENVDIEMTDEEPSVPSFAPAGRETPADAIVEGSRSSDAPSTSPPPDLMAMMNARSKQLPINSEDAQVPRQIPDSDMTIATQGKPGECEPQRLASLSKEELEEILLQETQARKKAEKEFQIIKESLQEQVKREVAYREEMAKQLQLVRGRDVTRSLCIAAPIDPLPRIGAREDLEIRCVAEAQRNPHRPAPFFVQDIDFTSLYRMRLQANPTSLNHLVPSTFHRKPCEGCFANNGKPRHALVSPTNRQVGPHEQYHLHHQFPGSNEMFTNNWTLQ